nr:PREDICTED: nucleoside diphosphate kinase 3 [Opisthocomus hoazin]
MGDAGPCSPTALWVTATPGPTIPRSFVPGLVPGCLPRPGRSDGTRGDTRSPSTGTERCAPPELQEKTLVLVKPDAVQRRLVGNVIQRFERRGFKLVAMKLLQASEELLKEHYVALRDRPFYSRLVKYMSSGPVVAMVWQGLDAVKTVRTMIGETNPAESRPGTIRGDFCVEVSKNVIHGSDSVESARQEISLWFRPEELTCWEDTAQHWVYA